MNTFSSFIADRKSSAARIRREMEVLRANKTEIQKGLALGNSAVRAAERVKGDSNIYSYSSVSVDSYDGSVQLYFSISERNAKQLNGPVSKRVLGTMMLANVELGETKKDANEWDAGTTTEGKITIGKVTCNFTIRTRLADEGATCEKVQVGVKTEVVETPIFEIRCNG